MRDPDFFDNLCGACHYWGSSPLMQEGKCKTCERTHDEIAAAHGVVRLDAPMKAVIFLRLACGNGRWDIDKLADVAKNGLKK